MLVPQRCVWVGPNASEHRRTRCIVEPDGPALERMRLGISELEAGGRSLEGQALQWFTTIGGIVHPRRMKPWIGLNAKEHHGEFEPLPNYVSKNTYKVLVDIKIIIHIPFPTILLDVLCILVWISPEIDLLPTLADLHVRKG